MPQIENANAFESFAHVSISSRVNIRAIVPLPRDLPFQDGCRPAVRGSHEKPAADREIVEAALDRHALLGMQIPAVLVVLIGRPGAGELCRSAAGRYLARPGALGHVFHPEPSLP